MSSFVEALHTPHTHNRAQFVLTRAAPYTHTRAHSKLINVAAPDTVDERALVFPKKGKALNVWEMSANANVAISSARAVGCKVVNIHTATIMKTVETDAVSRQRSCVMWLSFIA